MSKMSKNKFNNLGLKVVYQLDKKDDSYVYLGPITDLKSSQPKCNRL